MADACCVSRTEAENCELRSIGEERVSGPGEPSVACVAPTVPAVDTRTKSAALSFVSCGRPLGTLRMKLYSAVFVMPPLGESAVPSK